MLKRKYYSIIIIILMLSIFSIQFISAKNLPLIGVIITIDPGHGGNG